MEAMAVFTGSNISITSSSLLSTTTNSNTTTRRIRITSQLRTSATHLSAFPSKSHLFSSSSTSSYAKTIRTRTGTESGIFLPRLMAALEQVDQTYIMVKPDGVQRGLEHYKDLKQKPFFPAMIDYITSGPVVSMAWEGIGVVPSARKLIGATDPLQAEPGTIRGDLAVQRGRNVIHGSDSPENGQREIALWFKEGELCEWTPVQEPWLIE
ncbi:unnamed protein product [Trifolium pratense]|uniref:Uncharacterized protein n=1 Tax=Trifolium pratense TaxID=57577 RepID=A0ACB0L4B1_TRIPR|nr:unnamed protein product [Trifolium pratense]